ncbi:hypothetical protein ACLOJK_019482, partial [Asimina triloba]
MRIATYCYDQAANRSEWVCPLPASLMDGADFSRHWPDLGCRLAVGRDDSIRDAGSESEGQLLQFFSHSASIVADQKKEMTAGSPRIFEISELHLLIRDAVAGFKLRWQDEILPDMKKRTAGSSDPASAHARFDGCPDAAMIREDDKLPVGMIVICYRRGGWRTPIKPPPARSPMVAIDSKEEVEGVAAYFLDGLKSDRPIRCSPEDPSPAAMDDGDGASKLVLRRPMRNGVPAV